MARRIFYAVLVISLFAAGAHFLFFSDFFIIKDVAVSGNHFVASAPLAEKFKEQENSNLLLLNPAVARERLLAEFLRLDDVQIRKKYPDKVIINVKEKETQEILCRARQEREHCFLVDKNGIVFDNAGGIEGSLIVKILDLRGIDFEMGDKIFSQEFLGFIQKLKQDFPRVFEFNISALELEHPSQREVTVKIGLPAQAGDWRAIFDIAGDAGKQLLVLKQVLEKEIKEDINKLDYIDLRIEGRAYYKLK